MKKISIKILTLFIAGFAFSCNEEISSEVNIDTSSNSEMSKPSPPTIVSKVTIGNQIWTTTNLNVSRYRNGDIIPEVYDPEIWRNLTSGAYCTSECDNYTKLYNWYAVSDPRGLAPEGWHVPSTLEISTLANFLGGASVAGGKMKSTSSAWRVPNIAATNSHGFTALPFGGRLAEANGWYACDNFGIWWTSTETSATEARYYRVQGTSAVLETSFLTPQDKREGYNIRLIKN